MKSKKKISLDSPHTYFKKQLWDAIYEIWNDQWTQDKTCFHTERTRIMQNKIWEGTHLWKLDKIYELSNIRGINNALKNDSSKEED